MAEKDTAWVEEHCKKAGEQAQAQLIAIAEAAVKRHGGEQIPLSQTDSVRMGTILMEVQDQSFILGVQTGIDLTMESMKLASQQKP